MIGALAIVASTVINIIISLIARSWLHTSPTFAPLGIGPIIFWSVVCGIGATIVFGQVARHAQQPVLTYVVIAALVYLCTFIPDGLLISGDLPFKGATFISVITLMAMHAAEAIIMIITFISLGFRKKI
jgi:uncharacterized membrane protein